MNLDFTGLSIQAATPAEQQAARILSDEIRERTDRTPSINSLTVPCVVFSETENLPDRDSFRASLIERELTIEAKGIRGFLYGIGLFLRKSVFIGEEHRLIEDISGDYTPDKSIRGHQTGYRPTANSYEAWDLEGFRRYYLDMMYFGANTVEHIPYERGVSNRNALMRYDELDFLAATSAQADELDLNISLWHPNSEKDPNEAVANRETVFKKTPRIDFFFPPGSDPGDLAPEELFRRLEAFEPLLKRYHPKAGVWPSAQQPHHFPDWGERFVAELEKQPDCIDGIITGPNHAYRLEALRRKVPMRYPIRFYPDITHNLRCEYPVHFERDDWHYALSTVNGRESINPRPTEYAALHRLTAPYLIGSVSYSEGINDDVNKAVWSALDYAPETPVREILEDYARLFFPGADIQKAVDAIFGLEKNWEGCPENNPQIEGTLRLLRKLAEETPSLLGKWRFLSLLFRAVCDAFARRKILFENELLRKAKRQIDAGQLSQAKKTLLTPVTASVASLREEIDSLAESLFRLIGLQLSTEKYHASGWERGAILNIIDLPITDLPWLLNRFAASEDKSEADATAFMRRCIHRNDVDRDEVYYSVALHGLLQTGVTQEPEFYMDFQGDRPNVNDGSLPVCLQKLYDHVSFRAKTGGLTADCDYVLTVTYKNSPDAETRDHTVSVNGHVLWQGAQFGGETDERFTQDMMPEGFIAVKYPLPKEYIENGCAELLITEPRSGFEIAEFRITKSTDKDC